MPIPLLYGRIRMRLRLRSRLRPRWRLQWRPRHGLCLALLLGVLWGPASASALELWASMKDVFPVFNEPEMLSAEAAEAAGVVLPRDAVIGVARNGEAKAYPLAVMGYHELGNDTLGGVPIAVSW